MPSFKSWTVIVACAVAIGAGGCRKRAAQAAPPVVIYPAPDEKTQPTTQAEKAEEKLPAESKPAEPPKTTPELVVPPPKKSPSRPAPKTTPAETTQPAETPPPKPAPRMSPQLSPAEQAKYERETNDAITLAEANLHYAAGRKLQAAQRDLMEKTRGFLAQAREAMRDSDWVRARNLADKARVLSVELVNSL